MLSIARIESIVKKYLTPELQLAKDNPQSWAVNWIMKFKPETLVRWLYNFNHLHPVFFHHLLASLMAHISNFFN
jgi:hypothetical protein